LAKSIEAGSLGVRPCLRFLSGNPQVFPRRNSSLTEAIDVVTGETFVGSSDGIGGPGNLIAGPRFFPPH